MPRQGAPRDGVQTIEASALRIPATSDRVFDAPKLTRTVPLDSVPSVLWAAGAQ